MEAHPEWNCSRNYGQLSKKWGKGKATVKALSLGSTFGKARSPLHLPSLKTGRPTTPPTEEKVAEEPEDETKRVVVKYTLDFQEKLPLHVPDITRKLCFETPFDVGSINYVNLEQTVSKSFGHHFKSIRCDEWPGLIEENDHWEAFKADWLSKIGSRRHARA
jgi:hypothetical protein